MGFSLPPTYPLDVCLRLRRQTDRLHASHRVMPSAVEEATMESTPGAASAVSASGSLATTASSLAPSPEPRRKIPPPKSYLSLWKVEEMAEVRVPVCVSHLDRLVKDHGEAGQPDAPLYWNTKGRREIMGINDLKSKFLEHQERTSSVWGVNNTKKAMWTKLRADAVYEGIGPSSV